MVCFANCWRCWRGICAGSSKIPPPTDCFAKGPSPAKEQKLPANRAADTARHPSPPDPAAGLPNQQRAAMCARGAQRGGRHRPGSAPKTRGGAGRGRRRCWRAASTCERPLHRRAAAPRPIAVSGSAAPRYQAGQPDCRPGTISPAGRERCVACTRCRRASRPQNAGCCSRAPGPPAARN